MTNIPLSFDPQNDIIITKNLPTVMAAMRWFRGFRLIKKGDGWQYVKVY